MNKYKQLKFNIKREQKANNSMGFIEKYSFENYDWLKGNPRNLIVFFKQEINSNPKDKKLIKYCLKRIEIEERNETRQV